MIDAASFEDLSACFMVVMLLCLFYDQLAL